MRRNFGWRADLKKAAASADLLFEVCPHGPSARESL